MNGHFDPAALALLQDAYAMQLNNPEDQDIDATSGLPTGVVSNTSPWHGQMPLWRYPDGKNPLETAPIMFNAEDEEYEDGDTEEAEDEYEDDEDTEEEMTEEEVDALIAELMLSDDETEEE